MRARMRTYTAYSIGVGIVWAVLLVLASSARRGPRPCPGRPGQGHPVITCRIGQFFGSSQPRPAAAPGMIHARIAERRRARGTSRQPGPA